MGVRLTTLSGILLLATPSSWAATVLDIKNANADTARITIEGSQVRIATPGGAGYRLLDLDKGEQYQVLEADKRIMVVDLPGRNGNMTQVKQVRMVDAGEGPDIQGYPTHRYTLFADELQCATLYTSKPALEVEDLKRYMQVAKHTPTEKVGDPGAPTLAQAVSCGHAANYPIDEIARYGVPLKVEGRKGHILLEVTGIERDKAVADNTFALPADYKQTSFEALQIEGIEAAMNEDKDLTPEKRKQWEAIIANLRSKAKK